MTIPPNAPRNERMEELAARCEAAEAGEQRALLIEAWNAIHPDAPLAWDDTAIAPWRVGFLRFIEAEAWLNAALMLVPEGHNWQMGVGNHAWGAVYKGFPPSMRVDPIAATPALALTAAALRARAPHDEGEAGLT